MATLVNKMNREVKVIIPNMREFRVFYSDNEGSVMFFKRDWQEVKSEDTWKPSNEQMEALWEAYKGGEEQESLRELIQDLKKL